MPRKSKTIRCVLYARVSNDRQDVDNSNEHPGIGRSLGSWKPTAAPSSGPIGTKQKAAGSNADRPSNR